MAHANSKTSKKLKNLYQKSGVDTYSADKLVEWLQGGSSRSKQIISGVGGFAALYEPQMKGIKQPILVSSTDGVGTKLLLALQEKKLTGLGQDLVAMCLNDLYTVGATPLFFLDYFATGKLDKKQFKAVVSGIRKACEKASTELIGGETAELPGLYTPPHFDLAGFVVGMVDKQKILGPGRVKVGDLLFALPSTGFHSNGFSLLRAWIKKKKPSPQIRQKLLIPTKVYDEIPKILKADKKSAIHAFAHITGGGISGNLPRVIPQNMNCEIMKSLLPTPSWMQEFIDSNGASFKDVEEVFNMGVGMIAVVDKNDRTFVGNCRKFGLKPVHIGSVTKSKNKHVESEVVYEA